MTAILSQLVMFALVAWRKPKNKRLDYGETNDIRNSLAATQWAPDMSVPVYPIDASSLAAEMQERQTLWDNLKAAEKTADNVAKLTVFERVYVSDGKLIEPKYLGNAGFRRASTFFDAMVQRFTQKPTKEIPEPDNTFHGNVPVRVTSYRDEAERILDQQMENEIQGRGAKKMEPLEKLAVSKTLYENGVSEARLRDLYSSSIGQKTYGICRLNERYPDLKLYDRFYLPLDHADRIPWGPIDAPTLIKMNNRYDAQRKREKGFQLSESERTLEPITQEEVETWFRDKAKLAGDGNAIKSMPKKDIEASSKNHKLLLVRDAFESIINNTTHNLAPVVEHADAMNGVYSLVTGGKGEYATNVVKAAVEEVDVMKEVTALLAAGKKAELLSAIERIKNPPAPAPEPAATKPEPAADPAPESGKPGKKPQKQTQPA